MRAVTKLRLATTVFLAATATPGAVVAAQPMHPPAPIAAAETPACERNEHVRKMVLHLASRSVTPLGKGDCMLRDVGQVVFDERDLTFVLSNGAVLNNYEVSDLLSPTGSLAKTLQDLSGKEAWRVRLVAVETAEEKGMYRGQPFELSVPESQALLNRAMATQRIMRSLGQKPSGTGKRSAGGKVLDMVKGDLENATRWEVRRASWGLSNGVSDIAGDALQKGVGSILGRN
jgi:hypothetical protein